MKWMNGSTKRECDRTLAYLELEVVRFDLERGGVELAARKVLGWPKRWQLAHAFLWEYSYKSCSWPNCWAGTAPLPPALQPRSPPPRTCAPPSAAAAAVRGPASRPPRPPPRPPRPVPWGVATCHYWPIQTLGTPSSLGAQGADERARRQVRAGADVEARDSLGVTGQQVAEQKGCAAVLAVSGGGVFSTTIQPPHSLLKMGLQLRTGLSPHGRGRPAPCHCLRPSCSLPMRRVVRRVV